MSKRGHDLSAMIEHGGKAAIVSFLGACVIICGAVFFQTGCAAMVGRPFFSNHRMPMCAVNPTVCKPYKEALRYDPREQCMSDCTAGSRHVDADTREQIGADCREECNEQRGEDFC